MKSILTATLALILPLSFAEAREIPQNTSLKDLRASFVRSHWEWNYKVLATSGSISQCGARDPHTSQNRERFLREVGRFLGQVQGQARPIEEGQAIQNFLRLNKEVEALASLQIPASSTVFEIHAVVKARVEELNKKEAELMQLKDALDKKTHDLRNISGPFTDYRNNGVHDCSNNGFNNFLDAKEVAIDLGSAIFLTRRHVRVLRASLTNAAAELWNQSNGLESMGARSK